MRKVGTPNNCTLNKVEFIRIYHANTQLKFRIYITKARSEKFMKLTKIGNRAHDVIHIFWESPFTCFAGKYKI